MSGIGNVDLSASNAEAQRHPIGTCRFRGKTVDSVYLTPNPSQ